MALGLVIAVGQFTYLILQLRQQKQQQQNYPSSLLRAIHPEMEHRPPHDNALLRRTVSSSSSLRQPEDRAASAVEGEFVDILYGGQGAHPGFMEELQASLKSVLLNAPLDQGLRIHFLVDHVAQEAIRTNILEKNHLAISWKTRQPLEIHTYNVEAWIPSWTQTIDAVYQHFPSDMDWYRHTKGAYFRLFAHDILPTNVHHFIYMDSDVVILSNLATLWNRVQERQAEEYYFQWGQELCSGFLIIQKDRLADFWKRIGTYDLLRLTGYTVRQAQKTVHQKGLGDQFLLRSMAFTEPHLIGTLPLEWDVSANDGPWWPRNGTGLELDRPHGVGMLHFNGGGSSGASAFQSHKFLVVQGNNNDNDDSHNNNVTTTATSNPFPSTWGLAHFYNQLPWHWARYMAESKVPPNHEGYPILVQHHTPVAPPPGTT